MGTDGYESIDFMIIRGQKQPISALTPPPHHNLLHLSSTKA